MDDGRGTTVGIGGAVELEGQPLPDLVRDAVLLYLHLTPAARRAMHAIARYADADDHSAVGRAVSHALIQAGFDLARKQATDAAARAYPDNAPATEDDICEQAVQLTREARNAAG